VNQQNSFSDVGLQYAAAYQAHYSTRDLPVALQLYRLVLQSYPDSDEAAYSRVQIGNMLNAVIPKQELLDACIELISARFDHDRQSRAPGASGTETGG
jgi:hypothetical protein